jgi:hypothetical protein
VRRNAPLLGRNFLEAGEIHWVCTLLRRRSPSARASPRRGARRAGW